MPVMNHPGAPRRDFFYDTDWTRIRPLPYKGGAFRQASTTSS